MKLLKKLFNWIWSQPKQVEHPQWTLERNGWEASAKRYDDMVARIGKEVVNEK